MNADMLYLIIGMTNMIVDKRSRKEFTAKKQQNIKTIATSFEAFVHERLSSQFLPEVPMIHEFKLGMFYNDKSNADFYSQFNVTVSTDKYYCSRCVMENEINFSSLNNYHVKKHRWDSKDAVNEGLAGYGKKLFELFEMVQILFARYGKEFDLANLQCFVREKKDDGKWVNHTAKSQEILGLVKFRLIKS